MKPHETPTTVCNDFKRLETPSEPPEALQKANDEAPKNLSETPLKHS